MATTRLVELIMKGKDESQGAFQSLEKSILGVNLQQAKFAVGAAAITAAVVAASKKLYDFVAAQAAVGDAMQDMSERTGLAVETLSQWAFVVKRGGGELGDFEASIRKLAQSMGDAREGTGEAVDAFARLGIEVGQLVGPSGELRSVDEVLPQIAAGLQNISSKAERVDIVQALFGRGGTRLLPALENLREINAEFDKFGGAMTSQFAEKSAAFGDATDNLKNATDRLKETLAEPFLHPFTSAINALAKAVADGVANLRGGAVGSPFIGGPNAGAIVPAGPGYPASYYQLGGPAETGGSGLELLQWQRIIDGLRNLPMTGVPMTPIDLPNGGMPQAVTGPPLTAWSMDEMFGDIIERSKGVGESSDELARSLAALDDTMQETDTAVQQFGTNLGVNLGYAFADAITGARSFGESFVAILNQAFAQLLGDLTGNIFASIFGGTPFGIFGGLFDGKSAGAKVASAGTKALPGQLALIGAGSSFAAANRAYGKVYV
ncbi:MAG TPA: hypothetical protein PLL30_17195 [Candidatus Krumholzibacteria bacterium]|nr:hypothetical protein [Candidatus Krumholzibacteria bacterium]HRY42234.1 hypothetical protein [Candidatus Krumholzibacteria bacterium]